MFSVADIVDLKRSNQKYEVYRAVFGDITQHNIIHHNILQHNNSSIVLFVCKQYKQGDYRDFSAV